MSEETARSAADLAKRFGVVDYVVFSLSLVASAVIGLYFGCTGKKQRTTNEFLLADRSMSIIPVSMSLLASFMSAIAILGIPSEVYTFGTMYCWTALAYIPAMYLAGNVYIPVFYNLQVTSVYEYLELRFNRPTRILGAFCYVLQMVLYMAIALYAPSLALSAVTGINTWVSVIAIGAVCTFYTALGGMKAVLWTDTLQAAIMFMGMLAVVIQGFIKVGWADVWRDAHNSGRSDMFQWRKAFNPDPLERHSFWSLVVGAAVYWTAAYGTNQSQVQRALSVPSLRKAQLAFWVNLPGLMLIVVLGGFAGLIIYSYLKACDPILSGVITARDQLYPLFVMEVLGHIPGLPGLIVAAVASGALSTISSGLNSLSAVLLTDIVRPLKSRPISDEHAAIVSKIIAATLGVVCIALTFVVSALGGILQAAISLFGICGGPILGVFSLGMLFPCANGKGAFAGLLVSLVITMWIGVGAQFNKPYVYSYPVSTEGCPVCNTSSSLINGTLLNPTDSFLSLTTTQSVTTLSPEELKAISRTGVQALYSISYQWLTSIACIICTVIGLAVSFATGRTDGSKLDPRLISPVVDQICCCLPLKLRKRMYCGVRHHTDNSEEVESENNIELKL